MYMYVYIFPTKIFTLIARNPDLPSWDSLFFIENQKYSHLFTYHNRKKTATYGAIYLNYRCRNSQLYVLENQLQSFAAPIFNVAEIYYAGNR